MVPKLVLEMFARPEMTLQKFATTRLRLFKCINYNTQYNLLVIIGTFNNSAWFKHILVFSWLVIILGGK